MYSTIKSIVFGQGRISSFCALFLASLALPGVLCFSFPNQLTTPEFRQVYSTDNMKVLLSGAIVASFFFAMFSFLFSEKKRWAIYTIVINVTTLIAARYFVSEHPMRGTTTWYLGLDWLVLDLLFMAAIFMPIEMVFPKKQKQGVFHAEWRANLSYFVIGHLFFQFFSVVSQRPVIAIFGNLGLHAFHTIVQSFPLTLQLFLALFITDIAQYWTHRTFHSRNNLWRFHSVHHSTEHMDWLATSRIHVVEFMATRLMVFLPLYVLGFSNTVFNVAVVFISVHAVFIHANTRINFGLLKYLLVTPQYHYWHHCKDPKYYGKNFASMFPIIDRMFGTYYLPGNNWPEESGLTESDYPQQYTLQLIYPFIKGRKGKDIDA